MAISIAAALAVALAPACGDDSSGSDEKSDGGTDAASDAGDAADAGPDAPAYGACSNDGWCWELPAPQGNTLWGSWAAGDSDLWVVGAAGMLLHWDGKGWARFDSGTDADLFAVWGSDASHVWAVGANGTLLAYTGSSWQKVHLGPGAETGVASDFRAVHGTSSADVWVVGEGGVIWHLDGSGWTSKSNPNPQTLNAVFASASSGKAWAAGESGALLEWNGAAWATLLTAGPGFNGLDGAADGSLVVAVGKNGGLAWNLGGTWTFATIPGATTLRDVWIESPTRIWVFGDSGEVRRLDDATKTWPVVPSGTKRFILSAAAIDADSVLAVGETGLILRWDGEARSQLSSGASANRLGLSGTGPKDVWVVGDEVLHNQGSGWQNVDPKTPRALYDVSSVSADDAWAVGTGGTILRWQGSPTGWSAVESPTKGWLRAVHVTAAAGWIVGEKGTTLALLNQTSWVTTLSNTGANLNDVWVAGAAEAWAVGDAGTLLRWDGAAWAAQPVTFPGQPPTLRAVWGADAKHVWAVGSNGSVVRYDGKTWAVEKSGELYSLNDVWGSSATDVYAVGSSGRVFHWDGSAWLEQSSGVSETLNTVWGADAGHVWIAGEGGALLRRFE